MSPRTGRPKSNKPKQTQLGVRFANEQHNELDIVAKHYGETRAESIRRGVKKLYSEIKKE